MGLAKELSQLIEKKTPTELITDLTNKMNQRAVIRHGGAFCKHSNPGTCGKSEYKHAKWFCKDKTCPFDWRKTGWE